MYILHIFLNTILSSKPHFFIFSPQNCLIMMRNFSVFSFRCFVCLTLLSAVFGEHNLFGQIYGDQVLVFDRFGTTFSVEEVLQPPEKSAKLGSSCIGGDYECIGVNFDVVFDFEDDDSVLQWFYEDDLDDAIMGGTGFDDTGLPLGEARMDILCEVMTYLSSVFQTSENAACDDGCDKPTLLVRVNESFEDSSDPVLGAASPYFYALGDADEENWIAYGSPWRLVNGGTDPLEFPFYSPSYQPYHGLVVFNWGHDYHYNSSTAPSSGEHDLYTVVLHEFLHMFGFLSLVQEDGFGGIFEGGIYSKYDTYLQVNAGVANDEYVIEDSDVCAIAYNTTVSSSDLTEGDCYHMIFDSPAWAGTDLPVFAGDDADQYKEGSSLSHIDSDCYDDIEMSVTHPYFVMHPSLAQGVAIRTITDEELSILCDIGYTVDIDGATCGAPLVGIDDPCDGTFFFIANPCETYSLDWATQILANDINATDFNCTVSVDYGGGVILSEGNVATGDDLVFDPQGNQGWHVLSYYPTNGTEIGNRAYIYIKGGFCPGLGCPVMGETPPECSLICNPELYFGAFPAYEEDIFGTSFDANDTPGWEVLSGSPDYEPSTPSGHGAVTMVGQSWPADGACGGEVVSTSEAIWTPITFEPNTNYILSYKRMIENADWVTSFGIYLTALETIEITMPMIISTCFNGNGTPTISTSIGSECILVDPCNPASHGDSELLSQESFESSSFQDWSKFIKQLNVSSTKDVIYLHPNHNLPVGLEEELRFRFFLEQFELIRDVNIQSHEETVLCGNSVEIGDPFFCLPSDPTAPPYGMEDLTIRWQQSLGDETGPWIDIVETTPAITVTPNQLTTYYKVIREFIDPDTYYDLKGDTYFEDIIQVNMSNGCFCLGEMYDVTTPTTATTTETWTDATNSLGLSSPVRMNTELIIPPGVELTIKDMVFQFGSEGKILVGAGGKLILENTTLTGDPTCETMWQGIQVIGPGEGNIRQMGFTGFENYGVVELIKTTEIHDAIIGIAAMELPLMDLDVIASAGLALTDYGPNTNLSAQLLKVYINDDMAHNTAGGVCKVAGNDNAFFVDCFQGINLSWFDNDANAATITDKCQVSFGDFTSTALWYPFSDIDPDLVTEAGVQLNFYENMGLDANDFIDVKYGIRGYQALQLDIHTRNEFINCKAGISILNFETLMFGEDDYIGVRIDNNEFENCRVAVQCSGAVVSVTQNRVNDNTLFQESDDIGFFMRGSDFHIEDNNIISNVGIGTVLLSNHLGMSTVTNNQFNNCSAAVWSLGSNPTTQITCNEFNNHSFAFLVTDYTVDGVLMDSGVLEDQGICGVFDEDYPADNVFNQLPASAAVGLPEIFSLISADFTYYHRDPGTNFEPTVNDPTLVILNSACWNAVSVEDNCAGSHFLTDGEIIAIPEEEHMNIETLKKVRYYMSQNEPDSATMLLEDVQTTMAQRMLVARYINTGNYTQADQLLSQLPQATEEDNNFISLFTIYKDMRAQNRNFFELTATEEASIQTLAQSFTKSGIDAQAIDYILQGTEHIIPLELPDFMLNPDLINISFKNGLASSPYFGALYPNPTNESLYLDYQLPEEKSAELKLLDINGKQLHYQVLENKGTFKMNVQDWRNGIYFYQISIDGEIIQREKIVVIH